MKTILACLPSTDGAKVDWVGMDGMVFGCTVLIMFVWNDLTNSLHCFDRLKAVNSEHEIRTASV